MLHCAKEIRPHSFPLKKEKLRTLLYCCVDRHSAQPRVGPTREKGNKKETRDERARHYNILTSMTMLFLYASEARLCSRDAKCSSAKLGKRTKNTTTYTHEKKKKTSEGIRRGGKSKKPKRARRKYTDISHANTIQIHKTKRLLNRLQASYRFILRLLPPLRSYDGQFPCVHTTRSNQPPSLFHVDRAPFRGSRSLSGLTTQRGGGRNPLRMPSLREAHPARNRQRSGMGGEGGGGGGT